MGNLAVFLSRVQPLKTLEKQPCVCPPHPLEGPSPREHGVSKVWRGRQKEAMEELHRLHVVRRIEPYD